MQNPYREAVGKNPCTSFLASQRAQELTESASTNPEGVKEVGTRFEAVKAGALRVCRFLCERESSRSRLREFASRILDESSCRAGSEYPFHPALSFP